MMMLFTPDLSGCAFDPSSGWNIPQEMMEKWQEIIDLTARIVQVRAALIMRRTGEDLEVFMASRPAKHPYQVGRKDHYAGSGLYCERVIEQDNMLEVPDALKTSEWNHNPDLAHQMKCYLGFPIHLPNGECFGTICLLDDKENHFSQDVKDFMGKMRDLIESSLLLLQLSFTDPLTGLYNRAFFNMTLESEAKAAEQNSQPLAAILMDIDHFKQINDTLGHLEGDRVLKAFAEILTASLRNTDIAFRFGGDEFCVLMPRTDVNTAFEIAEEIRSKIEQANLSSFPVTASMGVSGWFAGESLSRWVGHADQALYKAKHANGNQVAK